ncbi:MAG: hypothetical protein LBN20_02000 [Endomicrobium sp.]|jgi:hypothetical protein|nr:hypothetical protein [Endomicrobium sp.]
MGLRREPTLKIHYILDNIFPPFLRESIVNVIFKRAKTTKVNTWAFIEGVDYCGYCEN